MKFIINYDPSILTVVGVKTSTLTNQFLLDYSCADQGGTLTISMVKDDKQQQVLTGGQGALLYIDFRVKPGLPRGSGSPVTLVLGHLNDIYGQNFTSALKVPVLMSSGRISIGSLHYLPLILR